MMNDLDKKLTDETVNENPGQFWGYAIVYFGRIFLISFGMFLLFLIIAMRATK